MFDTSKPFSVRRNGETIRVRYPSDRQWTDRARKHPNTRRVMGKSIETEYPTTYEFDAAIYSALRIEGPESLDGADAARIIDALDRCQIEDVNPAGAGYEFVARVFGVDREQLDGKARTVHTLRMPTQRQVDTFFRDSGRSRIEGKTVIETFSLDPGGLLYDACVISTIGYAGAVPLNHKAAIAAHLATRAGEDAEVEELDPEA